jgi:hypothetical protein
MSDFKEEHIHIIALTIAIQLRIPALQVTKKKDCSIYFDITCG